jgi:uncharacterized membrane-anchored protein
MTIESTTSVTVRTMLNKVPDDLSENLGLGLTSTAWVMGALLAMVLVFQFRHRKYVPGVYWLAVVLLSIVGTLITDNLTDKYNVALATTTTIFAVALMLVFARWYSSERTLSIHTIVTTRREGFYWLAILFTFAFGTAAGDYLAETLTRPLGASLGDYLSQPKADGGLGLGATATSLIFLGAILVIVVYLTGSRRDVEVVAVALPADDA